MWSSRASGGEWYDRCTRICLNNSWDENTVSSSASPHRPPTIGSTGHGKAETIIAAISWCSIVCLPPRACSCVAQKTSFLTSWSFYWLHST
eukprot:2247603-Rhodomonas_salina.1